MSKKLRCRDVGVDCDAEIVGETEDEVMAKCVEHAKTVHGMNEISAEMAAKVKAAIKDT